MIYNDTNILSKHNFKTIFQPKIPLVENLTAKIS